MFSLPFYPLRAITKDESLPYLSSDVPIQAVVSQDRGINDVSHPPRIISLALNLANFIKAVGKCLGVA